MKQKIRQCKQCGEPFVPSNGKHIFCSLYCKNLYYYKQKKTFKVVECGYCGKKFTPGRNGYYPNQKYCSDDCAEEMNRIKTKKLRFKLKREFPELYYNDLGSKGTSTSYHLIRDKKGKPDFKKEQRWLEKEKKRLGL